MSVNNFSCKPDSENKKYIGTVSVLFFGVVANVHTLPGGGVGLEPSPPLGNFSLGSLVLIFPKKFYLFNRPFSYSWYWTGTSLQIMEAHAGYLFKCK